MEGIKKGRCNTCGFLAVRLWRETGLYEATQEYREHGMDDDGPGTQPRSSLCFMQAARLDLEVQAHNKATFGPDMGIGALSIVAVIQKPDRNCSKWRAWVLGFSPKEHREMMDRERMLKWQRSDTIRNWCFRFAELALVAAGIAITAYFVVKAAYIEADATRDSARIQFEALKPQPTPSTSGTGVTPP
jgi:hypothetical protein